ncbi:hypothetical protein X734_04685 [Mesorhizobium sp. L2C084A000]|nr:hypothetical protein X734_04685 [Mesorhizobium sp. L2C084A000]
MTAPIGAVMILKMIAKFTHSCLAVRLSAGRHP